MGIEFGNGELYQKIQGAYKPIAHVTSLVPNITKGGDIEIHSCPALECELPIDIDYDVLAALADSYAQQVDEPRQFACPHCQRPVRIDLPNRTLHICRHMKRGAARLLSALPVGTISRLVISE
jgi:hypothetical protein